MTVKGLANGFDTAVFKNKTDVLANYCKSRFSELALYRVFLVLLTSTFSFCLTVFWELPESIENCTFLFFRADYGFYYRSQRLTVQ